MRLSNLAAGVSALAILVGGSAMAQETGDFINDLKMDARGAVSGNQVFTLPDTDFIWMRLPDGKVMGGYLFDQSGSDIGANLSGTNPADVWQTLESIGFTPPEAARARQASVEVPIVGQSSEITANAGDIFESPSSPAQGANAPAEPPVAGSSLIEDTMALAGATMDKASPEQKQQMMLDLVTAIDNAQNEEDFRLSVIEWAEGIEGVVLIDEGTRAAMRAEAGRSAGKAGAENIPAPVVPSAPLTPATAVRPVAAGNPLNMADYLNGLTAPISGLDLLRGDLEGLTLPPVPVADIRPISEQQAAQTQNIEKSADNAQFLKDIEEQATWIEVGNADAPPVYMFVDPLCPYCARAFDNLKEDVRSGQVQLRVILAPLVSKNSGEMISGILLSTNPANALWQHELQYAMNGASDILRRPFNHLPDEAQAGIKRNHDIVVKNQLRGVPFFAWEADGAVKMLQGVPDAGHFSAAAEGK